MTYTGNCTDYKITGNYFHHGCSNALGVGGHRFRIDNNLFKDIFFGYGGTKVGGAECIIIRNSTAGASDLTSYADIVHNTFSNYGTINFGGGTARYLNINVSYNQILGYDTAIGLGGNMDNINVIGNQISIQNLGYLEGQAIKFELSMTGLSASDILISGNNINVNADPKTGMSSNGISASVNAGNVENVKNIRIVNNSVQLTGNSEYFPIEIRNMDNVLFSGNYLSTDKADLDTSLYVISNNSVDGGWTVIDNVSPGKNLHIPTGSIVKGNKVGGLRILNSTVVAGNSLNGISTIGPNAWGGIINLAGPDNVVTGNRVDMSTHFAPTAAAIHENSDSFNNIITNNQITNIGARKTTIIHNYESTVFLNTGAPNQDRKEIELNGLPTKGTWTVGDRIYNLNPVAGGSIGWVCTKAGVAAEANWVANTAYPANRVVYAGTNVYRSASAGTSGTRMPSHTSGTATDGTVTWDYVGTSAAFKAFGAISS